MSKIGVYKVHIATDGNMYVVDNVWGNGVVKRTHACNFTGNFYTVMAGK